MQETVIRSLGQEDPLEKEMATHSSILAWEIPWTEEPPRLRVSQKLCEHLQGLTGFKGLMIKINLETELDLRPSLRRKCICPAQGTVMGVGFQAVLCGDALSL